MSFALARRSLLPLLAALVVLVFVGAAIAAPVISHYGPLSADFLAIRKPPSAAHPLGTDELGRDVLSRLIWGARASLLAGIVPVCGALVVSIPLGLLAGLAEGWIDVVLMRVTDAMLAVPFLITAIALTAFLGPGLGNVTLAIGLAALPNFLRLARGQTRALKPAPFIEAARTIGASPARIALRHVLPNILAPLLAQASLSFATALIAEASLAFLGLGQRPPAPSWGSMLNGAQPYLETAPWMAIWPGLAIFALVVAVNVLGDFARAVLDHRPG